MPEIEPLIAQYGSAVVFLWTLLEGETVVVIAGFLAHQHLMPFWHVLAAAFLGSLVTDQAIYFFGRRHADHRFVARISARPGFSRALGFVRRHPDAFSFGFRFVYGLRTVGAVAVAVAGVPPLRFLVLNAASALVWAFAFAGLGYVLGHSLETVLGEFHAIEKKLLYAFLAGVAVLVLRFVFLRIRHPKSETDGAG